MIPIEVPVNKRRIILFTILLVVALALGSAVAYWLYSINEASYKLIILIAIGIPLLLYALYINAKLLRNDRPALIIDDLGILDNVSAIKAGIIPWSNIAGLRTAAFASSEFLLVDLRNVNEVLDVLPKLQRISATANIKKYQTPILINLSSLLIDKQELIRIIQGKIKR